MRRSIFVLLTIVMALTAPAGVRADETALFTSVAPDALLLFDLSGSMAWNPTGGNEIYGGSTCAPDTANCTGTTYNCNGGYCASPKTSCSTRCSRLDIAKRAVFSILDDNNNGTIDTQDESSLGVRLGFMRFRDGNDTAGDYSSGNIRVLKEIGSKYGNIYCNAPNCASTVTACSGSGECVVGQNANGGTPLAASLAEAKLYLDANKAADSVGSCRQKFVIVVTDGADTYACSGNGTECTDTSYQRRREVIARAKALRDAGYKVFVVGFGANMPSYLQHTLNWMAYYGGTDNPDADNAGNTAAYSIAAGSDNLYPSGVTSCMASATVNGACIDSSGSQTLPFFANANEPGTVSLSGHAFLANNAEELTRSLRSAINIIREAVYSFSQASIQSSRTADENYLYEGSFQPVNQDSFWLGHLKKFQINADGSVAYPELWDAGTVLQATAAADRTIKTYKAGALVDFTTGNITVGDLAVSSTAQRDMIVGFLRGDPAYNDDNWKLGDIFRATPITVGTPSAFFEDLRDSSEATVSCCTDSTTKVVNAFGAHRCTHCRTSANGNRTIVAGANDGMFHIFKTNSGLEAWSFIPPNLLPKLKNVAHATHPTALTHAYFVDGQVTVADVWLGAGAGTTKSASDWHSLLIFGEGRGSSPYTWSSSQYCDSGMADLYSSTYRYYCGYWAFNIDNPLAPTFKWHLMPNSSQAPYLGAPWNKFMTGRILTKTSGAEEEKWVGFVGAGYNAAECSGGGSCDTRGKGFFVVDLSNGTILWSYNHGTDGNMDYSLPAPTAIVDTDNDGFIDTVYGGDLGGSMWRFKMCTGNMLRAASCTTADWSGGRLFSSSTSSGIRPIYTIPAVAKDNSGNLWVYFGTGDKTDPTAANAQERFYAVKDNDRTTMHDLNSLENVTSAASSYTDTSEKHGWYLNLTGGGEKMLADPTAFGGVVYFTTFTPASGSNACEQGGTASLYGLAMLSGEGVLTSDVSGSSGTSGDTSGGTSGDTSGGTSGGSSGGTSGGSGSTGGGSTGSGSSGSSGPPDSSGGVITGTRSAVIGQGIATAPLVSLRPGTSGAADLYVTVSGGGGAQANTQRINFNPPGVVNRTNILFWRDRRLQ